MKNTDWGDVLNYIGLVIVGLLLVWVMVTADVPGGPPEYDNESHYNY